MYPDQMWSLYITVFPLKPIGTPLVQLFHIWHIIFSGKQLIFPINFRGKNNYYLAQNYFCLVGAVVYHKCSNSRDVAFPDFVAFLILQLGKLYAINVPENYFYRKSQINTTLMCDIDSVITIKTGMISLQAYRNSQQTHL